MRPAATIVAHLLPVVQEDLDRDWTRAALAEASGYSEAQLHRAFLDVTGEAPMRYVRRLRLERAAHMFEEFPELPVTEVALRSGYSSPDAFSRAFRRTFGLPPSRFRADLPDAPPGQPRRQRWSGEAAVPDGLDPEPTILPKPPLRGWSLVLDTPPGPEAIGEGLGRLAALSPPPGPFELGALVQAWGWASRTWRIETRVFRLADGPPPTGFVPWRTRGRRWAVFAYDGPPMGLGPACQWTVEQWAPASGFRVPFAPVLSLLGGQGSGDGRGQVWLPVTTLAEAHAG